MAEPNLSCDRAIPGGCVQVSVEYVLVGIEEIEIRHAATGDSNFYDHRPLPCSVCCVKSIQDSLASSQLIASAPGAESIFSRDRAIPGCRCAGWCRGDRDPICSKSGTRHSTITVLCTFPLPYSMCCSTLPSNLEVAPASCRDGLIRWRWRQARSSKKLCIAAVAADEN